MAFEPDPDDVDLEDTGSYYKDCPDCGGMMSWCSCCDTWSQYCCHDYGTCECS